MIEEPIRILHVLTAMNMAGTETLLMNLYRNINRNEIQFDFAVSAISECAYDKEIERLGGKLYHYPRYTGKNHFQYVKWWMSFIDEHKEYHIIHGHIGSTAAIYLNIAKKKGRFTVAHSHSTTGAFDLHSLVYKMYSYPTRFIADQFFGCSKQALIDRYGKHVAESTKSRVIYNAIDVQRFIFNREIRAKVRAEYNISNNEIILITVGRLSLQKNPHEIVRICKMLKSNGVQFKFLWFGEGELGEQIRHDVEEKQLDDVISFMGVRSDINNVLQAADIFVFPSVWEGLGIACIEAQAAGLPTFCSNTIPIEAKVSDLCEFLPLNDTATWCKAIEKKIEEIKKHEYERPNEYNDVVNAGYDVKETAKWLEQFYISNW